MTKATYITVLGWEDRYILGLKQSFQEYSFEKVILFVFEDYRHYTSENLVSTHEFLQSISVELIEISVWNNDLLASWKSIAEWFQQQNYSDIPRFIVDLSTIPRETLWSVLYWFSKDRLEFDYVYYPPMEYSGSWLSQEPEKPRLLFKHSGEIFFERQTCLFVFSGFDPERVRQLYEFYEPKMLLVAIQSGSQFDNNIRNTKDRLREVLNEVNSLEFVEIDTYDFNECYRRVSELLDPIKDRYNLITSSLGPKISGLVLYKYQFNNRSVALTYVPCRLYSRAYSKGIGNPVKGHFEFD